MAEAIIYMIIHRPDGHPHLEAHCDHAWARVVLPQDSADMDSFLVQQLMPRMGWMMRSRAGCACGETPAAVKGSRNGHG